MVVTVLLALVVGVGSALLTTKALARSPRHSPWGVVVSRRVVVNLKSGSAVDGVLIREDAGLLFLRNASLLEAGERSTPLDGELVVERSEVDFVQAP